MGYYTHYSLEWQADDSPDFQPCEHKKPAGVKFCPECGVENVNKTLDQVVGEYIRGNENMDYAMTTDGESNEQCKWYDHQIDMVEMSKKFHGVLFTLSGEGEESGDVWKEYYKDGLVQVARAKIVIDEFDPAKLNKPPVKNNRNA